jgi:coenzyme PQQ precursor peptide PqqA
MNKESIMIWETPVAIDLRLGMEITMYAEHR